MMTRSKKRSSVKFQRFTGADALPININITPTSNTYDILQQLNGKEIKLVQNNVDKKPKIPPITIYDVTKEFMIAELRKNSAEDFMIRANYRNIQLFCGSLQLFNDVTAALKKDGLKFYTHEPPSEQMYKVVLYGLHNMPTAELQAELSQFNVIPELITVITPKNTRYDKHTNYVLHFKKGVALLEDLQKIRALFKTVVTWSSYKKFNRGPTQCSRCQRPGHGARHCNMPPRCEYCAGDHESKDCPTRLKFIADIEEAKKTQPAGTPQNYNIKLPGKCCNCGETGHFASDPTCKRKKIYADTRKRLSNKGRATSQPKFTYDAFNFPVLQNGPAVAQQNFTPPSGTFAQQFSAPSKPPNKVNFPSSNNNTHNIEKNVKPFSLEEIMSLTSEVMTTLRDVRTASREQVIMSVMQISMKYLFNDGSK